MMDESLIYEDCGVLIASPNSTKLTTAKGLTATTYYNYFLSIWEYQQTNEDFSFPTHSKEIIWNKLDL